MIHVINHAQRNLSLISFSWRMEHVDIVEGAAYLIEKMAGGMVDIDRELINNNT